MFHTLMFEVKFEVGDVFNPHIYESESSFGRQTRVNTSLVVIFTRNSIVLEL